MFPHYQKTSNTPDFHKEWFHLLETEPKLGLIAPREHAKSTIVNMSDNIFDICNHGLSVHEPYIVIFSDSGPQAVEHLDNIVRELEGNERLIEVYGKLYEGKKRQRGKTKWTEDTIITTNGVRVIARGWRFKARGMRTGEERPSKIVIDDIENDEDVISPTLRRKLKMTFERKILNLGSQNTKFRIIGTILHRESLLKTESEDPRKNWKWGMYKAMDEKGKILWEDWWTKKRLIDKKEELGSLAFAQEFLNEIHDDETSIFKQDWVKYAKDVGKDYVLWSRFDTTKSPFEPLWIVGGVDLSTGVGRDYFSFVTLGVGKETGTRYLLNVIRGKLTPAQQRVCIEDQYHRFNHYAIMVESNSFQNTLTIDMKEQTSVPVQAFTTTSEKFDLVMGINSLAVLFENKKFMIPSNKSDARTRIMTGHLTEGLLSYHPESHTEDSVMALWFANTLARELEKQYASVGYEAQHNLYKLDGSDEYN